MFALSQHDAAIKNLNLRMEKHGDKDVSAADFTMTVKASALLLDTIDPKLRQVFFESPKKGDQQPLPIDENNRTALALPYLKEQKLEQKFEGYEVEFGSLLGQIEPLFFADAKATLIKAIFIEGGSVELTIKVSMVTEEDDDAPLLAVWRRRECSLTLIPPTAETVASNVDDKPAGDTLDQQEAAEEAARLKNLGKAA